MAKRVHLYQASTAGGAKGTSLRRNRERGTQVHWEKMVMNKYLSIITLNVNGLNASIKRHRLAE